MKLFFRIGIIALVAIGFGGYFVVTAERARTTSATGVESDVATDAETTGVQRLGVFSHNTPAHKTGKYASCSSCHDMPEKNWRSPRRDKLDPFPDVTQYPYHDSCFACHRNDIFRAGRGFCSSCHTVDGPRATGGRGMLPFPNRRHAMQFRTLFPHDVHQDLLAEKRTNFESSTVQFIAVSFRLQDPPKQDPVKQEDFYNCAICHKSYAEDAPVPKYVTRSPFGLKDLSQATLPDTFIRPNPAAAAPQPGASPPPATLTAAKPWSIFFKTSPQGHDSCFSCHYQYQNLPPGKQSCAGCHELTSPFKPYFDRNLINRYSLKFNHERSGHEKDCMSCHVRITQNADVRTKDAAGVPIVADVPIVACRNCHEKAGQRQDISAEIDERAKSPTFQCTYCHTRDVGRYEIPVSHRKPGQ